MHETHELRRMLQKIFEIVRKSFWRLVVGGWQLASGAAGGVIPRGYPNGGELVPKWWEATLQMVGSYSTNGGKLLHKWWGATTQMVGT